MDRLEQVNKEIKEIIRKEESGFDWQKWLSPILGVYGWYKGRQRDKAIEVLTEELIEIKNQFTEVNRRLEKLEENQ